MATMNTSYVSALVQELNNQRLTNDPMLCDYILISGDYRFSAHRSVLAATCDYFKTKFESGFSDSESREQGLPEVGKEIVFEFLTFAYTGFISLCQESVEDILTLADFLCMKILKDKCSQYLLNNLSAENSIWVKVMVNRYSLDDINSQVVNFMSSRFHQLVLEDDILKVGVQDLMCMLQDEQLNYIQESDLYDLVLRWIQWDIGQRQRYTRGLSCLLEPKFLTNNKLRIINFRQSDQVIIKEWRTDEKKNRTIEEQLSREDNPNVKQDFLICRSRHTLAGDTVQLVVYSVLEDKWTALRSPAHGWEGLESMTVHQGFLYLMSRTSEDIRGYMHRAEEVRELLKLDPEQGSFITLPGPGSLRGPCRLVSHLTDLLALDVCGGVEQFDSATNAWCHISGPVFPSPAVFFLPMPYDRHLYVLRATSAGYSAEYADSEISLMTLTLIPTYGH